MTLLIHFGIYKTGSSFLQHLCAINQDYLREQGVFFPSSDEHEKMLLGEIAKGNTDDLPHNLLNSRSEKVINQLKCWFDDAKSSNCRSVLLSAESLGHCLALKRPSDLLVESALQVGYQNIEAIGFFRDLVEHAVSTYKHRAKRGLQQTFSDWIRNTYETPDLMMRMIERFKEGTRINYTLRPFKKDSFWMIDAFFYSWLQVQKLPKSSSGKMVNVSLSISEILVLRELRSFFPYTLDIVTKGLEVIPSSEKAIDNDLEEYVRRSFYNELKEHKSLLATFSRYFNSGESIKLLSKPLAKKYSHTLVLSEGQLKEIHQKMAFLNSRKGYLIKIRRKTLLYLRALGLMSGKVNTRKMNLSSLYTNKLS